MKGYKKIVPYAVLILFAIASISTIVIGGYDFDEVLDALEKVASIGLNSETSNAGYNECFYISDEERSYKICKYGEDK